VVDAVRLREAAEAAAANFSTRYFSSHPTATDSAVAVVFAGSFRAATGQELGRLRERHIGFAKDTSHGGFEGYGLQPVRKTSKTQGGFSL
jgi:hypothetical protein